VASGALFSVSAGSAQAASSTTHHAQVSCDFIFVCNGIVTWPNAIWGAQAEFQTEALVGVGSRPVYNRMRLDDLNHGCSGASNSWFSAGYRTQEDPSQTWYYWEECKPGSNDQKHFMYRVPANNYGFYWYCRMYRYNTTTYQIDFFYDNWTWYWSGTSYNDNMLATQIELGDGAENVLDHSDPTLYRYNQWEDNVNGAWHWQNSNGTITNSHPPAFGWNQRPHIPHPDTALFGNIAISHKAWRHETL
jgi:hypothetical protein